MSEITTINVCLNKHYFIKQDICPFCGKEKTESVDLRKGDCITCGQLCPKNAYGCNDPSPLCFDSMLD